MTKQNLIKQTLSQQDSIEHICLLLESEEISNRAELSQRVCEDFNFVDSRGYLQKSSCAVALDELAAAGHFILPLQGKKRKQNKSLILSRLSEPVPYPVDVPANAGDVKGLKLIVVETDKQKRTWNELMICEHPRGSALFVGRQLKYLVSSDHGLLGAVGFAASALHLAEREKWIGWNDVQRKDYLHRVIGMSRFLIRKSVVCQNLASMVLGMVMKALPDDFENKYNFRPWLVESFVDTSHFDGASYKASNWRLLGQTCGRGRQDRKKEASLSNKDIYIYSLIDNFRERMGLNIMAGMGALGPTDGVDSDNWAENEFGGAPIGDKRLRERLVSIVTAKSDIPSASMGEVFKGDKTALKGYYRLIDSPDESAFTMENVLLPHREQTIRRMQGKRTVLCIQDTSTLNYTHLEDCEGLDQITGGNQTGVVPKGLFLHSTFVSDVSGFPLGILKSRTISPVKKSKDDKRLPRDIPIEEKKTFTWIEHHRDMADVATAMPNTRLINVCDREGDFFELFDEQRRNSRVELLIRASHDRRLAPGRKLFSEIRALPVQNVISIHVPRKSARPKKSRQKASPARKERHTELEIRYMPFQIKSPEHGLLADKEPVDLWIVHAVEKNPPEGNKSIEWFILTTIKINDTSDAEECLRWYSKRWQIEEWHRVLKSGCRIEKLGHKTAERLRRVIAINLVIAWRIMLMKQMYRNTPELPAEVLFSDMEILTLKAYAKKKGFRPPDTVGAAIFIVAKFGGYQARKSDPPPGDQIIWRGYSTLQMMSAGFELFMGLSNDKG